MQPETSAKRKSKTVYRIAHPPPRSKHQQRFHIPPRKYLQLQQLSETGHGIPILDVVPATHHRHLKPGRTAGSEDIVVVNSTSEESKGLNPEALAVVRCSNGVAICMANGSVWKASKLRSGSYEFVNESGDGSRQCARWAVKRASASENGQKAIMENTFIFSVLRPNERRHAVIAKLSAGGVEVWDQYRSPEGSGIQTSNKIPEIASLSSESEMELETSRIQHLSQDLRFFILVSAMWVGLNEGFSPHWSSMQAKNKTSESDASASHANREEQRQAPLTRSAQSSPTVPQVSISSHGKTRSRRSKSSAAALERPEQFVSSDSISQAPDGRERVTSPGGVSEAAKEARADDAKMQGDGPSLHRRPLDQATANDSAVSKPGKHERRLSSLFKPWLKGR